MTLRQLIGDLRRLGNVDGALDQEIDLPAILDYCAVMGIAGASEAYADTLILESNRSRSGG